MTCPVRELSSPRVDQSARCPVRELAIRELAYPQVVQLPVAQVCCSPDALPVAEQLNMLHTTLQTNSLTLKWWETYTTLTCTM